MKRFMTIFLAAILSLSVAFSAAAAIQTNASPWAVSSMEYAYSHGLITDAELKKATSPMSRQEFCSVIMHFLQAVTGIERKATQESPFTDCDDPMVIAAYEAGIIGGVEPGKFAPNRTLTREQMAIMIARTLKVCSYDLEEGAKPHPFTDTKTLYDSSNDYIDELYGVGIVSGYADGTFGPFREMTVQEAVISFVRAYRYIMTGDAEGYHPLPGEEPILPKEEAAQTEEEAPAAEEAEQEAITAHADEVTLEGGTVALGMTAEEIKAAWGEPDRVDESLYGLERYIYLNDYEQYFFVTLKDGKAAEIFVPGTHYTYLEMKGEGTMADIRGLSHVSAVEHSGIIRREDMEARILMDYEGKLCGLLLQTKDFMDTAELKSTILEPLRLDLEAELLDMIQVNRKERGVSLLTWDKMLWEVALAHTQEMISRQYFDYIGYDDSTPFGRIMERGKEFHTASETIARHRGDVIQIYQEWMRNASKCNALMDSTMHEVGIGAGSYTKELYVTVDMVGQDLTAKKK
ncbi:MAG: S-layer homology domain-containing protein [Bacillota bacterium]|nr:S-layer homology domain-containing protein [Bacillota bacterium]